MWWWRGGTNSRSDARPRSGVGQTFRGHEYCVDHRFLAKEVDHLRASTQRGPDRPLARYAMLYRGETFTFWVLTCTKFNVVLSRIHVFLINRRHLA